ncbi:hypothetical protein TTHERM_000313019 (macronuclear) [Tetrahymena thermophila SB210]|uniref:Uncharacterized protein n=1 Tax=Tetrahymena thermophila (strain SB210) TaxID=312017 RepID=W7X494_TETTS|nr:hypothetical protein TTHERM_000313019 [Tetrahymena thermophila SB210]EWS72252.1 hypothetical protein TTHERM_000313019 [Tetrahymena thermophila SB210]|eukprot:XP_012655192.1 hypothetical protein TTHERM_000313019 [Tetrahymena thermophila SB210]
MIFWDHQICHQTQMMKRAALIFQSNYLMYQLSGQRQQKGQIQQRFFQLFLKDVYNVKIFYKMNSHKWQMAQVFFLLIYHLLSKIMKRAQLNPNQENGHKLRLQLTLIQVGIVISLLCRFKELFQVLKGRFQIIF